MGKQIGFYMVEEDEDEFMEFVRSTGDAVILPQTTDQYPPEEFTRLQELSGRQLGGGCVLWNRSISPQPSFEFYEVHGGCHCLDSMQSEVVDVLRSHLRDHRLSMGRLYIDNMVLQPDATIGSKCVEFIDWFDQLARWIRKNYPKSHNGARLSPRARELLLAGYELVGHVF